jgi:hypothetical protein
MGKVQPVSCFTIIPEDESHFLAHKHEMSIDLDTVYTLIHRRLAAESRSGEVRLAVKNRAAVGLSGIRRVGLMNKKSFWANREGRPIPSHLIHGRRGTTKWLCFWGRWQDPETFILTTFYPGKPAPMEIHDHRISMKELKAAVSFWARHALIIGGEEEH